MTRVLRTDYAAKNARGVTLYTFGDLASARRWARANLHRHAGVYVEAVEITARRVYTPRQPVVMGSVAA